MSRMLALYLAVSVLAAVAVVAGLGVLREYPWMLATFSGLGLGILVFMTLQTIERLRRQLREERERRLRR
jgi:threonine/homoserine/homoserine lactone efflux protein